MAADRTLDEQVAKRIFFRKAPEDHVFSPPHAQCVICTEWAPQFTLHMQDAFDLVYFMERRYGFSGKNGFMLTRKTDEGAGWYCEFPAPIWGSADGATPQEAIVKAALDAVGVLKEVT